MAALYADENFPNPCVAELSRLGHDVLTMADAGQADQAIPDDEVLAFAAEQKRVLLTFNRKDFIKLHNDGAGHAGIVVCTVDTDFTALAKRIHEVLASTEETVGVLMCVNRPNPSS